MTDSASDDSALGDKDDNLGSLGADELASVADDGSLLLRAEAHLARFLHVGNLIVADSHVLLAAGALAVDHESLLEVRALHGALLGAVTFHGGAFLLKSSG